MVVKINLPDDKNIVSRSEYAVSDIELVTIKKIKDNFFMFLFKLSNNLTDEKIFLQLISNDDNEERYKLSEYYFDNISNSDVNSDIYRKYTSSISEIKSTNVYNSDFSFNKINELNFELLSFRQVDKIHAAIMKIKFGFSCFIKSLFAINNLSEFHANVPIESVKIEHVKYDCTCFRVFEFFIDENDQLPMISHYTCRSGRMIYKFNMLSLLNTTNSKLINPLDEKLYESIYGKEVILYSNINSLLYNDILYIIIPEISDITNQVANYRCLLLNKQLCKNTGLIDFDEIFEKKEDI